eukprot:20667-Heterococcus_DN1.PRE.1
MSAEAACTVKLVAVSTAGPVTGNLTLLGAAVTVYTHSSVFIHHVLTDSAVCICKVMMLCKVMMSPVFVAMHTT